MHERRKKEGGRERGEKGRKEGGREGGEKGRREGDRVQSFLGLSLPCLQTQAGQSFEETATYPQHTQQRPSPYDSVGVAGQTDLAEVCPLLRS